MMSPTGVAFDVAANVLYVSTATGYNVRKFDVTSNTMSTLAGVSAIFGAVDGTGAAARFYNPYDLVILPGGGVGSNVLVVADVACRPTARSFVDANR